MVTIVIRGGMSNISFIKPGLLTTTPVLIISEILIRKLIWYVYLLPDICEITSVFDTSFMV